MHPLRNRLLRGRHGGRARAKFTLVAPLIRQPIERGIDFVGQVLRPHRRTVRRRTFNEALARLEAMPDEDVHQAANSYLGLLRQATHSHRDRARLANVVRRRGFAVDHELTKIYG